MPNAERLMHRGRAPVGAVSPFHAGSALIVPGRLWSRVVGRGHATEGRGGLTGTGAADPGRGEHSGITISVDDPRAEDVRALLEAHLAFSHAVTPVGYAFALDGERLSEPGVSFFSARIDGILVGVGALKRLDDSHAELKSMHTSQVVRRRGVGRAMVAHILVFAGQQGYRRISLETGTMDAYAPARALYTKMGFEPCEPFGEYSPSPYNTWMTVRLPAVRSPRGAGGQVESTVPT